MNRVFIIAEAGVNHNGSLKLAKRMVDVAAEAGADAVKFQTFIAENLVVKDAPQAAYQRKNSTESSSQYQMLKQLELDHESHLVLLERCQKKRITFLSTPFDLESISTLDRLGLETFKIPSGEITNLPYLRAIGALKKKIFISTGMADLGEIEDALDILEAAGTAREDITVLHCNTMYPTPFEDVNLLAMQTIRNAFGCEVGYSDHTLGIEIPVAAVALGAQVIEKHFTLDRTMAGPDHQAALEPDELKAMVQAVRNVERALGTGIKKTSPSERPNMAAARKSIVAARPIKKGELFSEKNLATKRPGTGLTPMMWDTVIGKVATRDYSRDEQIFF